MVFPTPQGQYEGGYDQTIGGEKTSDDPFQVSNNEFMGVRMWSTRVDQSRESWQKQS